MNVGDYPQINDYAALRGIHFRQDGLTPRGPSADVGRRYYRPYARRGVLCNYEFHSSYKDMLKKGWDLKATIEAGLSDPISYLNTNAFNLGQLDNAPPDAKRLFEDAARRVGYRFVLKELRTPERIRVHGTVPSRLFIAHEWENRGVAPCYESYALVFTLHDSQGREVASKLSFPETPTTLWWPQEPISEQTVMTIPKDLPPGDYQLKVAMIKPEEPRQHIQLALPQPDDDTRYPLCAIPAVRSAGPAGSVIESNMEDDRIAWHPGDGIRVERDSTIARAGHSLKVEGRLEKGWSYATASLDAPLYPSSKYRLTCWLKVDKLEPGRLRPCLKINVTDSEGNWVTNLWTSKYDTRQMGQWQRLVGVVETPPNAARGNFSLEKGGTVPVDIRCWLDDIRLEVLERS